MAAAVIFRNIGIALLLSLGVAACGRDGGGERAPERGDQAVAKVDGKTVWVSDVKREAVAQGLIGEGEPLDTVLGPVPPDDWTRWSTRSCWPPRRTRRKLDKDPVAQRRLAAARDRVMGDLLIECDRRRRGDREQHPRPL